MKTPPLNANPLELLPGYCLDQYWDNRKTLAYGLLNWEYNCMYQLKPKSLRGRRQVLHLLTMQTNHVHRPGGLMHNPSSPQGTFSILVFKNIEGKACYGRMKLKSGDIIFFDDEYTHNFINSGEIEFTAITIQKSSLGALLPKLTQIINHSTHDTDAQLALTLQDIWNRFTEPSIQKRTQGFQQAEDAILGVVKKILANQTAKIPKLTAGEKTALAIRNQVFHHMDGNVTIQSLAEQYLISEQTLQNSFKSLFGFTPNIFLRVLKLNLVHQELLISNPGKKTVSQIAYKWGFTHMGRFSKYYTELFEQNPSETLKSVNSDVVNIKALCVARKEEAI